MLLICDYFAKSANLPLILFYLPNATSVKSSNFSLSYWGLLSYFGDRRERMYRSSAVLVSDRAMLLPSGQKQSRTGESVSFSFSLLFCLPHDIIPLLQHQIAIKCKFYLHN